MDKQQLEAIRARDADDYAAADVLRNIRSAGNTDPELEATINMIADRRDLLAAYDALAARLAEAEAKADLDVIVRNRVIAEKSGRLAEAEQTRAKELAYVYEACRAAMLARSNDEIWVAVQDLRAWAKSRSSVNINPPSAPTVTEPCVQCKGAGKVWMPASALVIQSREEPMAECECENCGGTGSVPQWSGRGDEGPAVDCPKCGRDE